MSDTGLLGTHGPFLGENVQNSFPILFWPRSGFSGVLPSHGLSPKDEELSQLSQVSGAG